VLGNDIAQFVRMGSSSMGRKMGGLPVEVIYERTQKPERRRKKKTDKLIESDKVAFIAGYIW